MIKFILEIILKTWTNHYVKPVLYGCYQVMQSLVPKAKCLLLTLSLFYSHIPSHGKALANGCSELLWFLIPKFELCVGAWCLAQKLVTPSTQLQTFPCLRCLLKSSSLYSFLKSLHEAILSSSFPMLISLLSFLLALPDCNLSGQKLCLSCLNKQQSRTNKIFISPKSNL